MLHPFIHRKTKLPKSQKKRRQRLETLIHFPLILYFNWLTLCYELLVMFQSIYVSLFFVVSLLIKDVILMNFVLFFCFCALMGANRLESRNWEKRRGPRSPWATNLNRTDVLRLNHHHRHYIYITLVSISKVYSTVSPLICTYSNIL